MRTFPLNDLGEREVCQVCDRHAQTKGAEVRVTRPVPSSNRSLLCFAKSLSRNVS